MSGAQLPALMVAATLVAVAWALNTTPNVAVVPGAEPPHTVAAGSSDDSSSDNPPSKRTTAHPTTRARQLLAQGPLRGISLGLFSQDFSYDYLPLLKEIQRTGTDWIAFTCNYYQRDYQSMEFPITDLRSVPEHRLVLTIRDARALGLKVMLFPILLIQDPNDEHWRGTIEPSDPKLWLANYQRFIVGLAQLAEREKVELLSVGSEFNSMQKDTSAWESIIEAVRQEYHGAITYSANWDSVTDPRFLHLLDFVGMTTYFTLTDKTDPTVAELRTAWRRLHEDILLWQSQQSIPLIFTEVGFASQDGANTAPWNYYLSTVVDLQEQVDCYQAFTDVWQQEKNLAGVFFYNWFGEGGKDDFGYTPRDKPALQVIRQWFSDGTTGKGGFPGSSNGAVDAEDASDSNAEPKTGSPAGAEVEDAHRPPLPVAIPASIHPAVDPRDDAQGGR